jgi:hypothetical protein
MKSRRTGVIVAFLLFVSIVCGILSNRSHALPLVQANDNTKQGKWENYVLVGNNSLGDLQGRTNSLGEEGWEVTSVVYEQDTSKYVVFLKRRKN